MDEIVAFRKLIEDLLTYKPDYSVPEGYVTGWEAALRAMDKHLYSRLEHLRWGGK